MLGKRKHDAALSEPAAAAAHITTTDVTLETLRAAGRGRIHFAQPAETAAKSTFQHPVFETPPRWIGHTEMSLDTVLQAVSNPDCHIHLEKLSQGLTALAEEKTEEAKMIRISIDASSPLKKARTSMDIHGLGIGDSFAEEQKSAPLSPEKAEESALKLEEEASKWEKTAAFLEALNGWRHFTGLLTEAAKATPFYETIGKGLAKFEKRSNKDQVQAFRQFIKERHEQFSVFFPELYYYKAVKKEED